MKRTLLFFLFVGFLALFLGFPSPSWAVRSPAPATFQERVLSFSPSHKVYVRYSKAKSGKPTVVLLNGLIYSLENWRTYVELLTQQGFGVLQIAYSTQPESFRRASESAYFLNPEWGPNKSGVEVETLAAEVMAAVDRFKIKKFHLLSLSYSSLIAAPLALQNKNRIESLILVSPAVKPSHRYNLAGEGLHQLHLSQKALSWGWINTDSVYDSQLRQTLASTMGKKEDNYKINGAHFSDFFEGVYQMVRAVKWLDLKDFATEDLPLTHLILAEYEEKALKKDQNRFWELLSDESRGSLSLVKEGYHALPGSSPVVTVEITAQILRQKIARGEHQFQVNPKVESRALNCHKLLRPVKE